AGVLHQGGRARPHLRAGGGGGAPPEGTRLLSGTGFLGRLAASLSRTSKRFSLRLQEVFAGRTRIDDELFEELQALLLEADVGVPTSERLLQAVQQRVRDER